MKALCNFAAQTPPHLNQLVNWAVFTRDLFTCSAGSPFVCCKKLTEKGHFCWDTGQGYPPPQGWSEILYGCSPITPFSGPFLGHHNVKKQREIWRMKERNRQRNRRRQNAKARWVSFAGICQCKIGEFWRLLTQTYPPGRVRADFSNVPCLLHINGQSVGPPPQWGLPDALMWPLQFLEVPLEEPPFPRYTLQPDQITYIKFVFGIRLLKFNSRCMLKRAYTPWVLLRPLMVIKNRLAWIERRFALGHPVRLMVLTYVDHVQLNFTIHLVWAEPVDNSLALVVSTEMVSKIDQFVSNDHGQQKIGVNVWMWLEWLVNHSLWTEESE